MIQMSKDVTIGASTYEVRRVRPYVGSWIVSLLTAKMREARLSIGAPPEDQGDKQPPTPEEAMMATASYLVSMLTLEEQEQVQNLCMERCARYEHINGKDVPMPILSRPGLWAIPELEYDGPTVLQLVRECIAFNIAPFFIGAGSSSEA